jgi:ketosteroid isomerase-like protein
MKAHYTLNYKISGRSILRITAILAMMITMAECTTPPVPDTKVEYENIKKLQDEWLMAYQNMDIDKIMNIYADDAVVMAPNTPASNGSDEIRKNLEAMFSDTTFIWKEFNWTNDQIVVAAGGDLAYILVSAVTPVKTPEGIRIIKSGGIDIWKKINGEWKAVVDTWNNQLPGAGY